MRCSSKRLARFDQFERCSTSSWRQPGDCFALRGERASQACARHPGRAPPLHRSGRRGAGRQIGCRTVPFGPGHHRRGGPRGRRQPADPEPRCPGGQASARAGHPRRSSPVRRQGAGRIPVVRSPRIGGLLMSAEDSPDLEARPVKAAGPLVWSVVLNSILVAAFVVGAIPIVAIARGFADMVAQSKIRSGADWLAYGLAFTGLFLGAIFFAYAIKYYLSTVMVLLTALVTVHPRNGNHNGKLSAGPTNGTGLTRITGDGSANGFHLDLGYHPFVSVHVAAYNEKRVIERLLTALDQLDYPEYEVVVVDDSTDESVQILQQ